MLPSLFLFSLLSISLAQSSPPAVDLGYVKYTGYTNETAGIDYYRGIHYAQSPTGPLRWQKPVAIEHNNTYNGSTLDASQLAPACYPSIPPWLQAPSGPPTVQGYSEDCLALDVLVPSSPASDSLAVLVQIHGGGYTLGNAETYPGDALVHASAGKLIYVSLQYRLALFGFLGGSEIAGNGVQNAGLLDQRAALDWVQRNIRAFGGDPSQVTIWGGSAGGGSVSYQLLANGATDDPPFSAAIAEYPWWQPLLDDEIQEKQYSTALRVAGCADLSCLRALPAETLQQVNQGTANASYPGPGFGYGLWGYGPVVDGVFLRDLPDAEFKKGNFHKVPLIVDHDAFEGVIFSNMTETTVMDETMDAQYIFPSATPAFFTRLYELYPPSAFNSTFFQRQTWFGDFIIDCPTYQIASAALSYSPQTPLYKLTFASGSQLHGATSAFLNSNTTDYPLATNQTLAQIMSSYWISFAVSESHNPNELKVAEAPVWGTYGDGGTAGQVGFEVLGVTDGGISMGMDPDVGARCDFWSGQGLISRN